MYHFKDHNSVESEKV